MIDNEKIRLNFSVFFFFLFFPFFHDFLNDFLNDYFVYFFAFMANSSSISPLRAMKCSTSPSSHFFQLFHLFHLCLSPQSFFSLALSSLDLEPIWGSFINSYPFPFVKINVSTFHFLPHHLIHLHFVHLERLKMHSFEQPFSKDSQI